MSISGLGRIATAEKMSVEQLQEALRNKSLPAYIGIPLLEEKMDMRDRMMKMQAMQQAQQQRPPIAEQIMQRAAAPVQPPAGIDSLPANLASAEGYAGGGIVAFEDGGYVEPIRFQNEGLVPSTPFGRAVNPYFSPDERTKLIAQIEKMYGPKAGIAGMFMSQSDEQRQQAKDIMGKLNTLSVDELRSLASAQPVSQAAPTAPKVDAKIPDTAVAQPAAAAEPKVDQGIAAAPLDLPEAPKTKSIVDITKGALYGDDGKSGYFGRSEAREKALMEDLSKNRLQGKAFEDYEKQLKKEGEEAGLEKDQARYMALLKAGLAMMAGTSQHALENIGKGALLGAEDYQNAYKDLKKAERERTKAFALIEQARRAEDADRIKESNRLRERSADKLDASDRLGTQALMNAGIEDKKQATDLWKTQYAGAVQMRGQDMTLAAAQARMRPGFTMRDLAKYRSEAMKNISEDSIRTEVAGQLKIKAPKPGQDKQFDAKVKQAYEAAIDQYLARVMGGAMNSATSLQNKGLYIVPPGTE